MPSKLRMHLLTLGWALVVGVLLTLPGDSFSSADRLFPFLAAEWTDKLVHFLLFLVLAFLAYRSARQISRVQLPLLVSAVLASAYGLALEALQASVPGRSPTFGDMAADTAGVWMFALLALSIRLRDRP